ncbi:CD1375 family protein [Brevibacillus laterosporus]|uniref:CD1375 family protein n=1 Tax=Brevibacillus laterosporus TaxID=1465 RepID=A0AAP3GC54_BRELA|nr:CD1375 family protein [Brevibacillus laterosporus]MCR8981992.1 CD1375 family protein [Brevibacillus laterosporus]MCZ0809147.1 CD1375 family protein [Brevibacillus laterosporus]MCZ0828287.1 CD1375 family protein [Brevibacillus laterosporus]MCZ0852599.1 CD1375 family protein [Brevibacillus laterosporus]
MPVKKYMIPVYAVLVKSGEWLIDPTGSEEKAVPENYRVPVAEYLALQK